MAEPLHPPLVAHQSGDLAAAEKLYLDRLASDPQQADAHYNLGLIYGKQSRWPDAVRELSAALQEDTTLADAWFMLCEFAGNMDQHELSRFAGEQAVRLMPDSARAWLRYAIALSKLERDEDAVAAYRRSLALDPSDVKGWINLGVVCKNVGRPQETLAALHRAFEVSGLQIPDETKREVDDSAYGILDWHLSLAELLLGEYRQGFPRFRARFIGGTNWKRIPTEKPVWRGEDIGGKTILVITEGGHGDALMMLRYLPMLKQKGARVIFRVQPALIPLLQGWDGADVIYPTGEKPPADFDYHTAIFDLPHRFGTTLETIPAQVPYIPLLPPDAQTTLSRKAGEGARALGAAGEGPAVGVVWAGEPQHQHDSKRSLSLSQFSEIFAEPNCQFFSLNRDMRPGDRELLARHPVTDLSHLINDFADSARLVGQMDLIITCDSAVAHLAGAMGKPVWTLLRFAPDWRWLTSRDDTPWYPTMRLFRQTCKDDWSDVIARVRGELAK